MAKQIGDYSIALKNACIDTSCYWHTSHWATIQRNGCSMLANIQVCIDCHEKYYEPYEEGLKREHPEIYKKLFPDK